MSLALSVSLVVQKPDAKGSRRLLGMSFVSKPAQAKIWWLVATLEGVTVKSTSGDENQYLIVANHFKTAFTTHLNAYSYTHASSRV